MRCFSEFVTEHDQFSLGARVYLSGSIYFFNQLTIALLCEYTSRWLLARTIVHSTVI